ncbi:DUF6159 family protein [Natrialbaceae archaeon AArc-T1-2]|uniref:DUF6159 family protein n=1 Tax=Natrialbaceae archaeon AArc-T1-2 TaxID=3053904 RepID=UPI00255A95B1|nr:DUF6159 family protein [Natrialbaceae archaeon AArc-T1-2]WIV66129.1 DUF6159 family protein [Natrialbaceae archaeon AArc-T1-2]
MGLFSRLKTGFVLSVASLRVLRSHPKLAVYPLMSGVASIVFVLAVLGPVWFAGGSSPGIVELAALFVVYVGTSYIAALFNAGLVYDVGQIFRGNEPNLGAGLRAASNRSSALLVWAFASAVVGILIRALESRGELGAQLAAAIFSVGWAMATFFVVPVIVFEDDSGTSMFTESASIFKETWGETAGAKVGLGIVPALIAVAGLVLAIGVVVVFPTGASVVTGLLIAVAAVVLGVLVSGVITGVTKTALYVYATENVQPEAFRRFDFESLFDESSGSTSGPGGLTGQRGRI